MLRSTGATPPRTARQAVEVVRPRAGCQAGDGVWAGSGPQRVRTKWTARKLWVGSGRTTGPGVVSGGAGDGADAGPRAAATGVPGSVCRGQETLWMGSWAGRGRGARGGAARVQERLCMRSWSSAFRCKLTISFSVGTANKA